MLLPQRQTLPMKALKPVTRFLLVPHKKPKTLYTLSTILCRKRIESSQIPRFQSFYIFQISLVNKLASNLPGMTGVQQ